MDQRCVWNSLGETVEPHPPQGPRPWNTNVCAKMKCRTGHLLGRSTAPVDMTTPGPQWPPPLLCDSKFMVHKGLMWYIFMVTFHNESPETFWSLYSLCFSYVTCINQQSELRPLISFIEAPSLFSLSVLSTSGFHLKVCIRMRCVWCPHSQPVQTGKVKEIPVGQMNNPVLRKKIIECFVQVSCLYLHRCEPMHIHMCTSTHP